MRRTPTESYDHFDPRAYLAEYYLGLSPENDFVLRFYHETYAALEGGLRLLEVGGGPTVYQLISASGKAREIVFADYLETNLDEVRDWLQRVPTAFDWTPYLERVAALESANGEPSGAAALAARVRSRITRLVRCDLTCDRPLAPETVAGFDVVSSAFCLEGVTQDRRMFAVFLQRVASLLREGGKLVATVVRDSEAYKVGPSYFPACPLDEGSLTRALARAGFAGVRISSLRTDEDHGYTGIMAVTAERQQTLDGRPV
jgi:SAM-dependent methyltransferase